MAGKGCAGTTDLDITQVRSELVPQIKAHDRRSARAYEGVLHIRDGVRHLGWEQLLAYGLRDVIGILIKEGDGRATKRQEQARAIARKLGMITGHGCSRMQECLTLVDIHDKMKGIAHRGDPPVEEDLLSTLEKAERILHLLTAPQTRDNT